MRTARENHWRTPGPERRNDGRRDQVLRKITLALVTDTGACTDPRQPAGIDPYDSSLGTSCRDVWDLRRPWGQLNPGANKPKANR
jgi:hypothetical protein